METSTNPISQEEKLPVDVYHTSENLVIITQVAGVKLTEIQISVTNDVLTIRGERKIDPNINQENSYVKECHWGVFSRSLILPKGLNTNEINASFKDNILKIEVLKLPEAKTKVVKIQTDTPLQQPL